MCERLWHMRRGSVALLAIFLLSVLFGPPPLEAALVSSYRSEVTFANTVAHWKFDEKSGTTATDASGNGRSGALASNPETPLWVEGKLNGGIFFDGSDDYLSVSDADALDLTGSYTIAFYMRPQGTPAFNYIFWHSNNTNDGYYARWNDTTGTFLFRVNVATDIVSRTSLLANTWYHVAISYNGTTRRLYINGVEEASDAPGAIAARAGVLSIGKADPAVANLNEYNGRLDEFRIYSRALSKNDINKLKNFGAAKIGLASKTLRVNTNQNSRLTDGLSGFWSMNGVDRTSSSVLDRKRTGTLAHGTLTGTTPAAGKVGQAISFNGSSDYISMGDADVLDLGTGNLSVAFWMRSRDTTSLELVGKRNTDVATNAGFMVGLETGGTLFVQLGDGSASRIHLSATGKVVADGVWHHVIVTYNRTGNMTVYVDNVNIGSTSISAQQSSISNTVNFILGQGAALAAGNYYDGQLDEVRIYSRLLSAAEIELLYRLGR